MRIADCRNGIGSTPEARRDNERGTVDGQREEKRRRTRILEVLRHHLQADQDQQRRIVQQVDSLLQRMDCPSKLLNVGFETNGTIVHDLSPAPYRFYRLFRVRLVACPIPVLADNSRRRSNS